jgi:hypothetical protein
MFKFKRKKTESFFILALATALFFTTAGNAHAYLDPGTGSMILQAIAAIGIGVFLGITAFWRNIKIFFTNILKSFKPKK